MAKPKTKKRKPPFDVVAHLQNRARARVRMLELAQELPPEPPPPGVKPSTVALYAEIQIAMAKDEVRTMELLPEELAKMPNPDDPEQIGAAIDRAWQRVIEEHEREGEA
jgi:hypothetical protein